MSPVKTGNYSPASPTGLQIIIFVMPTTQRSPRVQAPPAAYFLGLITGSSASMTWVTQASTDCASVFNVNSGLGGAS